MLQAQASEGHAVDPTDRIESHLILITQGRYSGRSEAALLPYRRIDNDYLVVATNSARHAKPDWYLNLKEEPIVQIEIGDACFYARARTPTGQARLQLLPTVSEITRRTDHSIPRETAAILLSPMYQTDPGD